MVEAMDSYVEDLWLVRLLLQRGMAAIYFVAFVSALNQFRPLLGERGLLPVPRFLARTTFRQTPSIFHVHYSDRFFGWVAWTGIALSLLALLGISESRGLAVSIAVWLVLWVLYLSIVNVGQTFYGFGWESMLVEAGFFTAFLGPSEMAPSAIAVLILRWMLFRVELGAGLIKIRHDACWRKLTCLYYHHETQPLPNPLSWFFHRLPKPIHRGGVLFSHFVQLVVPFGLFLPQPVSSLAGALIVAHQLLLIVSGNYAWLNWLTVVLGFSAFGDTILGHLLPWIAVPETLPRPLAFEIFLYLLLGVTVVLSVQPTLNFFSKHQRMNFSYNPLHLVGSYGAFGSVTKTRYEIVLEGTMDDPLDDQAEWRPYACRAKPGEPERRPPQIAPYHLRLDWLLWFLPFSVTVMRGRLWVGGHEVWFIRLVQKLLDGDRAVARLFRNTPFPDSPPRALRARFYEYRFTTPKERRPTGAWWERTLIGDYLPPVEKDDLRI